MALGPGSNVYHIRHRIHIQVHLLNVAHIYDIDSDQLKQCLKSVLYEHQRLCTEAYCTSASITRLQQRIAILQRFFIALGRQSPNEGRQPSKKSQADQTNLNKQKRLVFSPHQLCIFVWEILKHYWKFDFNIDGFTLCSKHCLLTKDDYVNYTVLCYAFLLHSSLNKSKIDEFMIYSLLHFDFTKSLMKLKCLCKLSLVMQEGDPLTCKRPHKCSD